MGKSLGIVALALLIISLPIPFVGNLITFLALVVLCGAAFFRERVWTIAVDLLCWVKVFLFSPSLHIGMFGSSYMDAMGGGSADASRSSALVTIVVFAFLLAPLVVLWLRTGRPRFPVEAQKAED